MAVITFDILWSSKNILILLKFVWISSHLWPHEPKKDRPQTSSRTSAVPPAQNLTYNVSLPACYDNMNTCRCDNEACPHPGTDGRGRQCSLCVCRDWRRAFCWVDEWLRVWLGWTDCRVLIGKAVEEMVVIHVWKRCLLNCVKVAHFWLHSYNLIII